MARNSKSPFLTPNFATSLIIGFGILTFLLGVEVNDLYARKPAFAVGGVLANLIVAGFVIKTVEESLKQEAENKAEECLSVFHSEVHELKSLVETLDSKRVRNSCLEIVADLSQNLDAFEAKVNAAKQIGRWLSNEANLVSIRDDGFEIARRRYNIKEPKVLNVFAQDLYYYLELVRDVLPGFGEWEFDKQRFCLAYQEGLLKGVEPYIKAVEAMTQHLEELFDNAGAAKTISRQFLARLPLIKADDSKIQI